MSYTKNTWIDQDVERPKTYEVTNNQDGSITLTDSFGLVTELGTPVNAVNMNHIEDGIANCADIDLANLSDEGESHFLGKPQITNCILEAPNGVATYTSTSITIKQGLKVLFANGRNADGTLKNIEYTLPEDYTLTIGTLKDADRTVCLVYDVNSDTVALWTDINAKFYIGSSYPSSITPDTNSCLYNPATNVYSHYNGSAWIDYPAVYLGNIRTSNNTFTNARFVNSVDILKRTDFVELSGLGMPSNRYIDLTLGAAGTTYTAPANGWFMLATAYNGTHYLTLDNRTSLVGCVTEQSSGIIKHSLPAKKGDIIYVGYDTATSSKFKFIYAQGSESEAQ